MAPVIDLMEALKKSLRKSKLRPRRPLHLRPQWERSLRRGPCTRSSVQKRAGKKIAVNPPWAQRTDSARRMSSGFWSDREAVGLLGPFAPRFTPQRKRNPLLRLSRSDCLRTVKQLVEEGCPLTACAVLLLRFARSFPRCKRP